MIRRPRIGIGGPLITMAMGLLLAAIAFEVTHEVTTRSSTRAVAVLVLAVGSVWFAATKRTSVALAVLMLYLGTLDSYLKLATGSSTVSLVRDVLLYAIVAGLLVRSQVGGQRLSLPPLAGWILAYIAFVLVQIANPNGGTLLHSLAGVKPHLEFLPLFFLGYLYLRDVLSLRRFLLLLLLVAAANGVAGFIQFNLTPAQFAAWGPGYSRRINGTGVFSGAGAVFTDTAGVGRVRPFGLGGDIGGGGIFGAIALGGLIALVSLLARWRDRIVASLLGVGAVAAIVTSQGRGAVVAAVVTVLAFGVMTATSQRRLASLAGLAVAGLVAYFVVTAIVAQSGGDAFRYQGLAASKIITTTTSAGGRPGQLGAIGDAIAKYPLGAGLGVAGPASAQPGGSALTGQLNAESEFSFMVLEAGVPGMVAVVGFTLCILGLGLVRCRLEPDAQTRLLLAAVISPIAGILVDFYISPGSVGVPDGPYLWFAGGVIAYWLITVPRERARSQKATGTWVTATARRRQRGRPESRPA